ncbi:MAG: hypothetical protein K0S28_445 [Paucimonas sp.]|jgi:uncharacterized protein with NRDE domain|nr:hypothetical protein [Paucimonas sp.]
MCLIVFAWKVIPGMPLLAAGNRDEFYRRPSAPAAWWSDSPDVYAGRDLQGGGTWIGITRDGRFAAVTNIRAPGEFRENATSRGRLVADFLAGDIEPQSYLEQVRAHATDYNGFNLLLGNRETLIWYSNRGDADERNGKSLVPGVYGISNALLDVPWPKVVRAKAQFSSLLCQGAPEDAYFDMLADTTKASDCRLPRTGLDIEQERMLSPVCIESADYGTRVSTVVQLYDCGSAVLHERPLQAVAI